MILTMAHRRKKETEGRRKDERKHQAHRSKRVKQGIAAVVTVVLLVLLGWQLSISAPPRDWIQCTEGGLQQHKHFWLHIQIGEKAGELNQSFIRIPEGLGITGSCMFPMHTHTGPGERDLTYVKVHVEATDMHPYTLTDFFTSWSKWMKYPRNIYFAGDGVSYYRTQNFEQVVGGQGRGGVSPGYVPNDGEYIDLIVHEPFQTVPGPYPGGELPITADYTTVQVSSLRYAFSGSASGGVAPYTFEWDFGDGSPRASGDSLIHDFPRQDNFTVTMYAKDSTGALVTKVRAISVTA